MINSRQRLARQLLVGGAYLGSARTTTTAPGARLLPVGNSAKSFSSCSAANDKPRPARANQSVWAESINLVSICATFDRPGNHPIWRVNRFAGTPLVEFVRAPKPSNSSFPPALAAPTATNTVAARLQSGTAAIKVAPAPLAQRANRPLSAGNSARLSPTQPAAPADSHRFETIKLTRPRDHVLAVELDRPKARNAFSLDTAAEFLRLFDQVDSDPTVRCVLLSGSGPDFTSGVDLKSFMTVYAQLQQTEDVAHRAKLLRSVVERFQAPFKRMHSSSKPIVCVAHGLCLGLGIELAACSDIRFVCADSRLAIREVLIGIAADVGSLQLMPKLAANRSLLNELVYTGRYLEPEEALQLGFASRLCATKEAALAEALQLAQLIASRSPVAVQGSKQNMRFSCDKPFLVGLDYNATWNAAMMQGADVVKAIEAILSKTEQVDYEDF